VSITKDSINTEANINDDLCLVNLKSWKRFNHKNWNCSQI